MLSMQAGNEKSIKLRGGKDPGNLTDQGALPLMSSNLGSESMSKFFDLFIAILSVVKRLVSYIPVLKKKKIC